MLRMDYCLIKKLLTVAKQSFSASSAQQI